MIRLVCLNEASTDINSNLQRMCGAFLLDYSIVCINRQLGRSAGRQPVSPSAAATATAACQFENHPLEPGLSLVVHFFLI